MAVNFHPLLADMDGSISCDVHEDMDVHRAHTFISDKQLLAAVNRVARDTRTSVASLCHTAFSILYARHIRSSPVRTDNPVNNEDSEDLQHKDVLYGMTSAGRSAPLADASSTENIIGPVINTFPVRVQYVLGDERRTIESAVQSIHMQIGQSVEYGSLPLSSIMSQAQQCRGALFNAIFDFQQEAWDQVRAIYST